MLSLSHDNAVSRLSFIAVAIEEAKALRKNGDDHSANRVLDQAHTVASSYIAAYNEQHVFDHQNERGMG